MCVYTGNRLFGRTVQKKKEWVFQSETGIVMKVLYLDIGRCLNIMHDGCHFLIRR